MTLVQGGCASWRQHLNVAQGEQWVGCAPRLRASKAAVAGLTEAGEMSYTRRVLALLCPEHQLWGGGWKAKQGKDVVGEKGMKKGDGTDKVHGHLLNASQMPALC